MAKNKLSDRQQAILSFIKSEILTRGYPPAVREICEAVGLKSTASVHAHLESLEKRGYIRRDPSKPRAIEVTDDSFPVSSSVTEAVPLLRADADTMDLLSERNVTEYITFPRRFLPEKHMFMLKVQGTEIKSRGILEGDILIAAVQNTADEGDIAVISADKIISVTVLEQDSRTSGVRRKSGTDSVPEEDGPDILGKVTGIFRLI